MGLTFPITTQKHPSEDRKKLYGPSNEVIAVIEPEKASTPKKEVTSELPDDKILEHIFLIHNQLVEEQGHKKILKNLLSIREIKEQLEQYILRGVPLDHAIRLLQMGITFEQAMEKMRKHQHSLSDIIGLGEIHGKKSHYFIK